MPQEAKWIRQLIAGEPAAWAQLLDEWSPRLYHYITANGAGEGEAQALLRQIFSMLVQKVVGSPPFASLTVLIFAIAYQQMLPYCQQRTTAIRRQLPPLLSPRIAVDPQATQLLQALHQFSPEVQQVALLYYLCEVAVPNIAQIVGQPEPVIKKTLYRVKHQLGQ